MFVFVYLNHIGRAEPEVRRDSFSIHQDFSLLQPSRVFPACDYIQESDEKRKKLTFTWSGLRICVRQCLCVCMHMNTFLTMFYHFRWRP